MYNVYYASYNSIHLLNIVIYIYIYIYHYSNILITIRNNIAKYIMKFIVKHISYRVTGLYWLGKTCYLHSLQCNNSIIAQFSVQ